MARKTPAEAARTRQRILDAAGAVFSRDGIAETTLEQIAQQAGVSRGAIYWHFKGKRDLLQTLFDEQKLPLEYSLGKDTDLDTGWRLLRKALIET
ncbi:MAG TPA: TetR family transcriptional regulator, partial [Pseudomonas sp.]